MSQIVKQLISEGWAHHNKTSIAEPYMFWWVEQPSHPAQYNYEICVQVRKRQRGRDGEQSATQLGLNIKV